MKRSKLFEAQASMKSRYTEQPPTAPTYPSKDIPPLLTTKEVAAILKVSESTVYRRFAHLPGILNLGRSSKYKLIRIPLPVLQAFLAQQSVGGAI